MQAATFRWHLQLSCQSELRLYIKRTKTENEEYICRVVAIESFAPCPFSIVNFDASIYVRDMVSEIGNVVCLQLRQQIQVRSPKRNFPDFGCCPY